MTQENQSLVLYREVGLRLPRQGGGQGAHPLPGEGSGGQDHGDLKQGQGLGTWTFCILV